jgi:hypothetical protein
MGIFGRQTLLRTAFMLAVSAGLSRADDTVPPEMADSEMTFLERHSVFERPRPDYDPLGIRTGSFLVFPTAKLAESYDTNVFATTTNTKSDLYTTLSPGIAARSDWNVHALGFSAKADTRRYMTQANENATNFAVRGDGRLDVLRDIYALGGAGYQLLHEERSSPDSVNGKKPVEYHVTSANLGYVHELGRLGARVDASVDSFSFNNATKSTGATINQHDRDRIVYAVAPRLTYEIVPGYHAFAKLSGNGRDYVQKFDSRGFQRSSKGYEVDLGTALDFTHVVNGEVFIGYLSQFYDDPRLKTVSGLAFGGTVLWNVTQLTSVRAIVSRTIQETTQFATVGNVTTDAGSYLQSVFTLSLEHELLRNVLLSGLVSYVNSDYQGITRTDDQIDVSIAARYLITRNLSATADLTYTTRSSDVTGVPYDRGVAMLALKVGF